MSSEIQSSNIAPAGRSRPMPVAERHFVSGNPLRPPFAPHLEQVVLGLGCFWGAERIFWQIPGVFTTAAGYAGGVTPNANYQEVCAGLTGHAEVILVVYDPKECDLGKILQVFWESHDPTQGMRQGNDIGTQYRSAIFATSEEQLATARLSQRVYQEQLTAAGYPSITTEIGPLAHFYYAEDYHQQYLAKNTDGYCGIGGTGVSCPLARTIHA